MPNTRSAAKRMRADRKRRLRNLEVASRLKSTLKKFRAALDSGNGAQARELYPGVARLLDQAAGKKALHHNTASRQKSRLARRLAALDKP